MTTTEERPEPARSVWFVRNVPQHTRTLAGDIAHDYGTTIAAILETAVQNYALFTREDRIAIQEARHRAPNR